MPENLQGLYQAIWAEAEQSGLSLAQRHYAVGRIMFDVFERAEYEERKSGLPPAASAIDKISAEIPERKITRGIDEAQEEFGKAAAQFMADEIERQIEAAIQNSIVAKVMSIRSDIKAYTSGFKTFFANVTAGVVSGVAFAAILMFLGAIYERDPSPLQMGKRIFGQTESHSTPKASIGADPTNPPAVPPPSQAQQGLPGEK